MSFNNVVQPWPAFAHLLKPLPQQIPRIVIAESEAAKARVAVRADIKRRDELLSKLQDNLKTNNAKLARAQQAQAEVIRKTRELNDEARA